jgi:hypothetical protein
MPFDFDKIGGRLLSPGPANFSQGGRQARPHGRKKTNF